VDPYTVVRRQGDRLVAIPYSVHYREHLEPAARLLERAAQTTSNASLKRFLTLRAQSFRSNDYFQSEMAWMDLEGPSKSRSVPTRSTPTASTARRRPSRPSSP
jgi:hypothetical protein